MNFLGDINQLIEIGATNMDPEVPLTGLLAVPIVSAVLQVFKPFIEKIDVKLVPPVALVLGTMWNIGANIDTDAGVTPQVILIGVVMGLAASGLYSQVKTIRGK